MRNDRYYMMRAITLAKRAEGKTSPNPPVGCILVKNKKIIAEGYHKKAGSSHAEVVALRRTSRAKGSTMYVTLEPCDHYGKTPPCTDAIIKSGLKKVVIALKDPNPLNNGKGIRKLKSSGIRIKKEICKKEAAELYRPYIKFIREKIPFVSLKIAESLDGKIATSKGQSKWISSPSSRQYVHKLRSKSDAVMVGINTVLKDDPTLIPKMSHSRSTKFTKRIIIDSHLKIPLNSRLVRSARSYPLLVATTQNPPQYKKKLLIEKGVEVVGSGSKGSKVNLRNLLRILGSMNIMHLLVEGGGKLAGSLMDEHLVDRAIFFIAPKIIGGKTAVSAVRGEGVKRLKNAVRLRNIKIKRFAEDVLIEGDL